MGQTPGAGDGYREPSAEERATQSRANLSSQQDIDAAKAEGAYYNAQREAIPVQSQLVAAQTELQRAIEQNAQAKAFGHGGYDITPLQSRVNDLNNQLSTMALTPAVKPVTSGKDIEGAAAYRQASQAADAQARELQQAMDAETKLREAALNGPAITRSYMGPLPPSYTPSASVTYNKNSNTYTDSRANQINQLNETSRENARLAEAQATFEADQNAKALAAAKSIQDKAASEKAAQETTNANAIENQRQSDLKRQFLANETNLLSDRKSAAETQLARLKAGVSARQATVGGSRDSNLSGYDSLFPNSNVRRAASAGSGASSGQLNRI